MIALSLCSKHIPLHCFFLPECEILLFYLLLFIVVFLFVCYLIPYVTFFDESVLTCTALSSTAAVFKCAIQTYLTWHSHLSKAGHSHPCYFSPTMCKTWKGKCGANSVFWSSFRGSNSNSTLSQGAMCGCHKGITSLHECFMCKRLLITRSRAWVRCCKFLENNKRSYQWLSSDYTFIYVTDTKTVRIFSILLRWPKIHLVGPPRFHLCELNTVISSVKQQNRSWWPSIYCRFVVFDSICLKVVVPEKLTDDCGYMLIHYQDFSSNAPVPKTWIYLSVCEAPLAYIVVIFTPEHHLLHYQHVELFRVRWYCFVFLCLWLNSESFVILSNCFTLLNWTQDIIFRCCDWSV